MKYTLQDSSIRFFQIAFLVFSVLAVISAAVGGYLNTQYVENETLLGYFGYLGLFFVAIVLFYRFGCEKKYSLFLGLMFCFVLRLFVINTVEVAPFSDYQIYHETAELLAKGAKPLSDYGSVFPHTVGYSYVLSFLYRLFGANPYVMQFSNVVLETLTAFVLFLCTDKLFGKKIGHLAVFLYAISPSFVLYSELLVTEVLFSLLFLILVYLAILFGEQPKASIGILFGIITGLTNIFRPCGMLILLAFCLYAGLVVIGKRRLLALLLAVFCYTGTAFGIFNALEVLNGQSVASFPMGYNLYIGANEKAMGRWNEIDDGYAKELMYDDAVTPDAFHEILLKKAIDRYRDNGFWGNLKLMAGKFGILWGSEMLVCDYLRQDAGFFAFDRIFQTENMTNAFHFLLMASVLFGACKLLRQKRSRSVLYICIFIMGITAQHLVAEVQERYSYTALLSMMPIAALGISVSYQKGEKLFV